MEAPAPQAIEVSSKNLGIDQDEQDKAINECCSCCYDCSESCFGFLCCLDLCEC